MVTDINKVNKLHELYYGKGKDRRFPKMSKKRLKESAEAAEWLRKNKKSK